jgi:hypothetical protein
MANIIKITSKGREYAYNQSYQKNQSEILSNPNQYGLYTADQYQAKHSEYNRGVTDGRNNVLDHPNNFDLFTASQFNNHDIPRKLGFKWESYAFIEHEPPYTDDDVTDYGLYLDFYVNGSKVRGSYSDLYIQNYEVNKGQYKEQYQYRYGTIDETIDV